MDRSRGDESMEHTNGGALADPKRATLPIIATTPPTRLSRAGHALDWHPANQRR